MMRLANRSTFMHASRVTIRDDDVSLGIANTAAIIDVAVLPHLLHRSRHAHHQDVHRSAGYSAENL